MLSWLVITALLLISCNADDRLRIVTKDFQAARLDPNTGEVTCIAKLELPKSTCDWTMGLGTRGQTSAVFYRNMSLFFVAQEACDDKIGRTLLFQSMGPFCSSNEKRAKVNNNKLSEDPIINIHTIASLNIEVPLNQINMAWDHTCNIVVISPDVKNSGTVYHTYQVSEYDGQIRPQVSYEEGPKSCKDCWRRKNPGLGTLDFGLKQQERKQEPEWNCGESCLFYTLEEHIVDNNVVLPRQLVGRSFRVGTVGLNITDSVQIQTLSWNPAARINYAANNQFLGIGVCCVENWCHPDCASLDSHLVLISFSPYVKDGQHIKVLADIGDKMDAQTIQMGVEISSISDSLITKQAYVYYDGTVISYNLEIEDGVVVTAKKANQTPKIGYDDIIIWAYPGYI